MRKGTTPGQVVLSCLCRLSKASKQFSSMTSTSVLASWLLTLSTCPDFPKGWSVTRKAEMNPFLANFASGDGVFATCLASGQ